MKNILSLTILCFCLSLQAASVLVLDKGKTIPIVRPDDSYPAVLTACSELSDYLVKLTGGEYPIKTESELTDNSGAAIYVGDTKMSRSHGIDCSKLGREEWVLRSADNALIISGGKPRGTYYAVLEFLEAQGVVWPDELTEYVPAQKAIAIKDMDIHSKPAIEFRRITLGMSTANATTRRFLAHMRNNDKGIPETYGGGEEMSGAHTFHSFTSPDWPDEYFCLSNGKRLRSVNGGGPGQLCMSNKDMQKAVLAKLRQMIAKDRSELPPERWPRIYDISQNDNESACTCPNCLAIKEREGAYSGVLLDFINFVADGIAEDYPDVLVQTFAYCHTLKPPKSIRPSKNVLMRVCKLGREFSSGNGDTMNAVKHPNNSEFASNLDRWAEISEHVCIWDYWVLYNKDCIPYVNVSAMHDDIRTYLDHKANNMLVECEYPDNTSFSAFKQWLGYRLMVHPEYSLEDQTDKFFNAFYGAAAPMMKEYLHYLERRMAGMKSSLAQSGSLSISYLDREFFEKANGLFSEAEKAAAGDAKILERIGYEHVPVDAVLLEMRAKFDDNLPSGGLNLQQLYERYRNNLLAHTAYYFKNGEAYNLKPGIYDQRVTVLDAKKDVYFNSDMQIPEEYRDRLFCDINWSYGSASILVSMPDAFSGKALRLRDGPNYHRLPIDTGIYDNGTGKGIAALTIPEEKIPQDEKFHYYSFGRRTITPQAMCWFNWSWLISLKLDYAYDPATDNNYEIVFSMKVTGEPYVKGSKTPTGLYIDRVLVLK